MEEGMTTDATELLNYQEIPAENLKLPELGDAVDEIALRHGLTMLANFAMYASSKKDSDHAAITTAWLKREMSRQGYDTNWYSNDRAIDKKDLITVEGADAK
jgi:hypothetical protein